MPTKIRGRRTPCILVVDDDSTVRQAFDRVLSQAGYRVLAASSLHEVHGLLSRSEHHPDAAVLDYLLPDGSGLEVVQPLLRRLPMCKSVVVTGVDDEQAAAEAARVGAYGYFRKPCSRSQLIGAVGRTVQASREWRQALGQVGIFGDDFAAAADVLGNTPQSGPVELDINRMVARLQYLGNLSPVETITAWRLLWGDSNDEIAQRMGCTRRTVKFHVSEILARTGGRSRSDLLRILLEDTGVEDPWRKAEAPPGAPGDSARHDPPKE